MKFAQDTPDEKQRLVVLINLATVYSPAEKRFDDITRLARQVFDVPVALVSMVTKERQWFKSRQGLDAAETPRRISFCGHAIQESDVFVVEDARQHEWFSDNPLVTGDPYIRFYAGCPLEINGQRVGTLCILDSKPRQLSPQQIDKLKVLAESVEEQLGLAILSKGQQVLLKSLTESEREPLIDPLTKMWNRQGLELVMLEEFRIAGAENCALVLAMLEVEGLDSIRSQDGSDVDKTELATLANQLREGASESDVLALYNANTFAILFDYEGDVPRERRVRDLLALINGSVVQDYQISLYVRAATMTAYSPANLSVANLLIKTDAALAMVREEPPGSIHFYDRRESPRE